MVDCADRMHLWMTEWAMKPLGLLREPSALVAVTIRPPGRGRRVHVTIGKVWLDGTEAGPRFRWSAREVDERGVEVPGGRAWDDEAAYDDPEGAYWAAADAIASARAA